MTVNRDGFYLGDDVEVDGRDGIVDNLTYAGLLVKFNDNTMKWIPNGMATRIDPATPRKSYAGVWEEAYTLGAEDSFDLNRDASSYSAPSRPNPYDRGE
jgi:hypothetical protein